MEDQLSLPSFDWNGMYSTCTVEELSQLVIKGDFDEVKRLATRELVTKTNISRQTVLMLVADKPETPAQAEKCIWYLVALGADLMVTDEADDTVAHLAARRDHLRLLALLPFNAKWRLNKRGATPLMEAARTGSLRCAKHLLHLLRQIIFNECREYENSKRERLLGLQDSEGRTALDLAMLGGHSGLACFIWREMRLTVNKSGELSGLMAQELEDLNKLEELVRTGDWAGLRQAVNWYNCEHPYRDGLTFPTMMVARINKKFWILNDGTSSLHLYVQNIDPTCSNIWSFGCLHHAAWFGNSAAASALLQAGASANQYWSGCSPLMVAANFAPSASAVEVSRVLIDAGAFVGKKDSNGKTALDYAEENGKRELAKLLRRYEGKKYFDAPDQEPERTSFDFFEVPRQQERVQRAAPLAVKCTEQGAAPVPAQHRALGEEPCSAPVPAQHPALVEEPCSAPVPAEHPALVEEPCSAPVVDQYAAPVASPHQQMRPTQDFYPVTDPQGFCIIININKYRADNDDMSGLDEERHGSQRDVKRVKRLFKKLNFIVKVREDLTAEGIDNYLSKVKQSQELAKHGSFVCFLMAHGNEGCIVDSDGNPCKISDLRAKFQSNVCSNLAGKPKIFFIQACRGKGKDEVIGKTDSIRVAQKLNPALYPTDGDFLTCYATTEGQVSFRDKEGSFYVQTLCDYIEKYYETKHLEDIMKCVNLHMMNNPYREGELTLRRVSSTVGQLAYKVSFDPSRAEQC